MIATRLVDVVAQFLPGPILNSTGVINKPVNIHRFPNGGDVDDVASFEQDILALVVPQKKPFEVYDDHFV